MCQMAFRDSVAKFPTLFLSVPRFQLMSNRKNQHDIFGGNPTIFRNVAEPAGAMNFEYYGPDIRC
jgi:hypothetical protein